MVDALLAILLHAARAAHADEADELLRRGKLDAAIPLVQAAAEAHPDDVALQERWIDVMLSLGLPEPVQRHATSYLRDHPLDPDAHYLVGRAATDAESSLAAYEAALRVDPDHARAWMGIGAVHRAAGRLRDAGEAYRRALLADPSLDEAWAGLLAAFLAAGEAETAARLAREAVAKVPELAEGWLILAEADPAAAGGVLREAARVVGWDVRVQVALAEQLLREGDLDGADAAATRALAVAPADTDARLARMLVRERRSGALDAAGMASVTSIRRRSPTDPAAARAAADALVAGHPRSALARLSRAHLRATTDPAGARADLESALALAPGDDEIEATLGKLVASDDPARAAILLDRAVAARPGDASLALASARARAAAGDLSGALERVTAAEARHALSLELAVLRVGLLARLGRAVDAWEAARAAAARIPDPRMQLAAAAAAVEAGRLRDAADLYEELAARTGRAELRAVATKLRELAGAPR